MPVVRTRRCPSMHVYDLLEWPDGTLLPQSNGDPDDDTTDCPECGAVEFEKLASIGQGVNLNKGGPVSYPYWDETLGVNVESHAHMLRAAAAKGLKPMESRHQNTRDSAETRAWNASADEGEHIVKQQESEPWYREMMDRAGTMVQTPRGNKRVLTQEKFQEFSRERRPRRD